MGKIWIRLGCFLIGYNYTILKSCSEVSATAVKKYLAALLIVCTLWGFIGYSFTARYIIHEQDTNELSSVTINDTATMPTPSPTETDTPESGGFPWNKLFPFIGALVMIIMVIQIERQIILDFEKNWLLRSFRIVIALVMAIIGSVIIDQILFKQDIEKRQISYIIAEVNQLLPEKTDQINKHIADLDASISKHESDLGKLKKDVENKPHVKKITVVTEYIKVIETVTDEKGITTTKEVVKPVKTTITEDVPNPKLNDISNIENEFLPSKRSEKTEWETKLMTARDELEEEIKGKRGFLDELNVLFSILLPKKIDDSTEEDSTLDKSAKKKSTDQMGHTYIAAIVWLLWFIFFLTIELFVLISKIGDRKNDYDATVLHQRDTRLKLLEELGKNSMKRSEVDFPAK